ncbi:hypothetical protein VNI00_011821 [Paramarasmius palmivorus]|uniref:Uncharacterized protein n=1 Tax=Paramarasmius palmivorus TaxID=297713 RepID=A0AAW0C988_9AGAR
MPNVLGLPLSERSLSALLSDIPQSTLTSLQAQPNKLSLAIQSACTGRLMSIGEHFVGTLGFTELRRLLRAVGGLICGSAALGTFTTVDFSAPLEISVDKAGVDVLLEFFQRCGYILKVGNELGGFFSPQADFDFSDSVVRLIKRL